MIVATAGHIDHGKTALVRALAQADTDQLAEEKRRGLSIDLGFAYADFGGNLALGFVDVPGHERFVRNMLAGVAAVDYALLVIAADDGPMPQTLEHLAILDLLGINHGSVALTKIDRVSADCVHDAHSEIQSVLTGTSLAGAPIFPLSSLTHEGIPELRAELVRATRNHRLAEPSGFFRLTVDRCFTLQGAGWIATGTALSGTARVGDPIRLFPGNQSARIRGIHVHNTPADVVQAGQRCAINLAGDLKGQPVRRGDWLVAPELNQSAEWLDVSLRLPSSSTATLKHWARVQLHLGAAARNCRVALLESTSLSPGETGLARLVLDSPVHAVSGDRFIIRDPAAQQTLAGGKVLEPFGPRRGRAKPERLGLLRTIEHARNAETVLAEKLALAPSGVPLELFARAFNLEPSRLEPILVGLEIATISTHGDTVGLRRSQLEALSREMLEHLDTWHVQQPDSLGLTEPALNAALASRPGAAIGHAVINLLLGQSLITRHGFYLQRVGHEPRLENADQDQLNAIAAILEEAGLRPPIVGELAERLALSKSELLTFLERMQGLGHLVRIAPNRYFLPGTVTALARIAAELAAGSPHGNFTAAEFRDRSGIGRNLSIQVLEYLDRAGVTHLAEERRRMRLQI